MSCGNMVTLVTCSKWLLMHRTLYTTKLFHDQNVLGAQHLSGHRTDRPLSAQGRFDHTPPAVSGLDPCPRSKRRRKHQQSITPLIKTGCLDLRAGCHATPSLEEAFSSPERPPRSRFPRPPLARSSRGRRRRVNRHEGAILGC